LLHVVRNCNRRVSPWDEAVINIIDAWKSCQYS